MVRRLPVPQPVGSLAPAPLRQQPGHAAPTTTTGQPDGSDLQANLSALSRLATGRLELAELLREVVTFAVRAIPGADAAGLTWCDADCSDLDVTTSDVARQIDGIQRILGQGPRICAAREGHTISSRSLGADPRWPRFGGRVARLGVHSAVCAPLHTSDGVIGVISVYAHGKHAFDDADAALAELIAVPAALAVENAQILAQARRLAVQLEAAIESRSIVDRAVGIIISRTGTTSDEALARLRKLSQHEHLKLIAVAHTMVDEAARRARARRTTG